MSRKKNFGKKKFPRSEGIRERSRKIEGTQAGWPPLPIGRIVCTSSLVLGNSLFFDLLAETIRNTWPVARLVRKRGRLPVEKVMRIPVKNR